MPPKWRTQITEAMVSLRTNIPCVVCCGKNKKLKTKHLHVTDQCLATTELAREVALLRTNWE